MINQDNIFKDPVNKFLIGEGDSEGSTSDILSNTGDEYMGKTGDIATGDVGLLPFSQLTGTVGENKKLEVNLFDKQIENEQKITQSVLTDPTDLDKNDPPDGYEFKHFKADKVRVPTSIRGKYISSLYNADVKITDIDNKISSELQVKYDKILIERINEFNKDGKLNGLSDQAFRLNSDVIAIQDQVNKEFNAERMSMLSVMTKPVYDELHKTEEELIGQIPRIGQANRVKKRMDNISGGPDINHYYLTQQDDNYVHISKMQSWIYQEKKKPIDKQDVEGINSRQSQIDRYYELIASTPLSQTRSYSSGEAVFINGKWLDARNAPNFAIRSDNVKVGDKIYVGDHSKYVVYETPEGSDIYVDAVNKTDDYWSVKINEPLAFNLDGLVGEKKGPKAPLTQKGEDELYSQTIDETGVDPRNVILTKTEGQAEKDIDYYNVIPQGTFEYYGKKLPQFERPIGNGMSIVPHFKDLTDYGEYVQANGSAISIYAEPNEATKLKMKEINAKFIGDLGVAFSGYIDNLNPNLSKKEKKDLKEKILEQFNPSNLLWNDGTLNDRQYFIKSLRQGEKVGPYNLPEYADRFIKWMATTGAYGDANEFSPAAMYSLSLRFIKETEEEYKNQINGITLSNGMKAQAGLDWFSLNNEQIKEYTNKVVGINKAIDKELANVEKLISENPSDQSLIDRRNRLLFTQQNNVITLKNEYTKRQAIFDMPKNDPKFGEAAAIEFEQLLFGELAKKNLAIVNWNKEIDLKRTGTPEQRLEAMKSFNRFTPAGYLLGFAGESTENVVLGLGTGIFDRGLSFINSTIGFIRQAGLKLNPLAHLSGYENMLQDYTSAQTEVMNDHLANAFKIGELNEKNPDGTSNIENILFNASFMVGGAGFDLASAILAPEFAILKSGTAAARYINRLPGLFGMWAMGNFYNDYKEAEAAGLPKDYRVGYVMLNELVQSSVENIINVKKFLPKGAPVNVRKIYGDAVRGAVTKMLSNETRTAGIKEFYSVTNKFIREYFKTTGLFYAEEFMAEETIATGAKGAQGIVLNKAFNTQFEETLFSWKQQKQNLYIGLSLGSMFGIGAGSRGASLAKNEKYLHLSEMLEQYGADDVYNQLVELRNSGSKSVDLELADEMIAMVPYMTSASKPSDMSNVKWLSVRTFVAQKEKMMNEMRAAPKSMESVYKSQIQEIDAKISEVMTMSDDVLSKSLNDIGVTVMTTDKGVPYFYTGEKGTSEEAATTITTTPGAQPGDQTISATAPTIQTVAGVETTTGVEAPAATAQPAAQPGAQQITPSVATAAPAVQTVAGVETTAGVQPATTQIPLTAEQQGIANQIADLESKKANELSSYTPDQLGEAYRPGSNQTIGEYINQKYDPQINQLKLQIPQYATQESQRAQQEGVPEGRVPEYAPAQQGQQGQAQATQPTAAVSDIDISRQRQSVKANVLPVVQQIKALADDVEDGATFNSDGTRYTGGGIVVPIASRNTTREKLSDDEIADFANEHRALLATGNFKIGIYKFPNSNMVSIDLNIVTDRKNLPAALEFAKLSGQESVFDMDNFENIKTGADGMNVRSYNTNQLIRAAADISQNRVTSSEELDAIPADARQSTESAARMGTQATPASKPRPFTPEDVSRMSDAQSMTYDEFEMRYPGTTPQQYEFIRETGYDNQQDYDAWKEFKLQIANQIASDIRDAIENNRNGLTSVDMKNLSIDMQKAWSKIVPGLQLVWDDYERHVEEAGFPDEYKEFAGFFDPDSKVVYLNPDKIGLDTPIHEFGHVWFAVASIVDPKLIERGKNLIRGTEYEARVRSKPHYADMKPEVIEEEALILAIGEKGADIIDQMAKRNFMTWLNDLWKLVASKFGVKVEIDNLTLEEFLNIAAMDVLSGGGILLTKTAPIESLQSGVRPSIVSAKKLATKSAEAFKRYNTAVDMRNRGLSPAVIWEQTGMENIEGTWLTELNYAATPKIKIGDLKAYFEQKKIAGATFKISDILSYPEFYSMYPNAKGVIIEIADYNEDDWVAAYNPYKNKMFLNLNDAAYNDVNGDYTAAILHEIQHYIQTQEGWNNGSSPQIEFPKARDILSNAERQSGNIDVANTISGLTIDGKYEGEMKDLYDKVYAGANFMYHYKFGEVQARNVEARYADASLRKYAPTATQDRYTTITQERQQSDNEKRMKVIDSDISEPTNIKASTDTKYGNIVRVKPGGHNLSFVQESDLIDIKELVKDIMAKGQTVWFWTADQLGRGIIADETIDGEHYLDAGPSYALDPKNRELGIIWATSAERETLVKRIGESDYIFIISGSPQKSKLFNKAVISYLVKRIEKQVGSWEKFRDEVIGLTTKTTKAGKVTTNAITRLISSYPTVNSLLEEKGDGRKQLFIALEEQRTEKKGTPLRKYLDQNNISFDVNNLRDGFFSDNNFNINDVMLVLKPTGIGGTSEHSTYQTNLLGEVVGVPNRVVNAINILPDERRVKYKENQKGPMTAAAGHFVDKVKAQTESVRRVMDSNPYSKFMTQDSNNYYFFHWSNEQRKVIDPNKFGNNRITSREERIARPSAAFFYTRPDFQEMGVGGYGHVVAIPKDKVYPATSDPLNLFDEAKALFERSHPGMAFGPNQQIGWITKVANSKGYEMVVAKWGNQLRAETTNKVKPEWYQMPDGWGIKTNPKYAKLKKGVNKTDVRASISTRYGLEDGWATKAVEEAYDMLRGKSFEIIPAAGSTTGFTLLYNGTAVVADVTFESAEEFRDQIIKTSLMQGYPQISEMTADNILFNAKRKNISKKPGKKELPENVDEIESTQFNNRKKSAPRRIVDGMKRWMVRNFTVSQGAPKFFIKLKESRVGNISYMISRAESMVKGMKAAAKKIKFEDWKTFDMALRNYKPHSPSNPNWTGQQAFAPSNTQSPEFMSLPDEMKAYVVSMRAMIDGISEQLVRNGLVSPDLALVLEDNMGNYVHRSYAMYTIGQKWADKLRRENKKWNETREGDDIIQTAKHNLVQLFAGHIMANNPGLSITEVGQMANRAADAELESILQSKAPVIGSDENSFLPYRNTGSLNQRRENIPEWLRKLLGEFTDPGTSFLLSVAEASTLLHTSGYLASVRDKGMGTVFFEEGNRPQEASVRISAPDSKMLKPLDGLYTTPEMAQVLYESENSTRQGWPILWKVMNINKMMKTIYSPVTQMKNFGSNTFFAINNGHFDVRKVGVAARYFAGQLANNQGEAIIERLKPLFVRGVLNQSLTARELNQIFKMDDIEQYILDNSEKSGGYTIDMIQRGARKVGRGASRLYQASDDFWKIYAYYNEQQDLSTVLFGKKYDDLNAKEKDVVDNESADRVMNTYPTYDRILGVFKGLSKAAIFGNFIAFRAESFRVFGNTVAYAYNDIVNGIRDKNPRMVAYGSKRLLGMATYNAIRMEGIYWGAKYAGLGVSGLISSIWGSLFGGDDDDEERQAINSWVPSWAMADCKIYDAKKAKDGKLTFYPIGSMDPYAGVFNIFNAYSYGSEWLPEGGLKSAALEVVAPFIEPEMVIDNIMSAAKNKDQYGWMIYNEGDDKVSQAFEGTKYVAKKTLIPGLYTWVERMFYSRDEEGNKVFGFNKNELIYAPFGRFYDVDMGRSWKSRLYNTNNVIFKQIDNQFKAEKKNGGSYEDNANFKWNREILRLHKMYKDGIALGYPEEKLKEILIKDVKMERRVWEAIVTGQTYQAYDKEGKITIERLKYMIQKGEIEAPIQNQGGSTIDLLPKGDQ